ncbi:hypothetical protein BpHYR1_011452 [Brachionus plicatilis]|uniref:Uncharacterized protein n=1 Tax=Brachionus plicatilis TaxID=10195 RepID=A0A3M7QEZ5_BRAPC|nr:hypothetical protein BpHYR1_011452 [Brachionus plicatilis]
MDNMLMPFKSQYNLELTCKFSLLDSSSTFAFSTFPLGRVEEKKESKKGIVKEESKNKMRTNEKIVDRHQLSIHKELHSKLNN